MLIGGYLSAQRCKRERCGRQRGDGNPAIHSAPGKRAGILPEAEIFGNERNVKGQSDNNFRKIRLGFSSSVRSDTAPWLSRQLGMEEFRSPYIQDACRAAAKLRCADW